MTYIYIYIYIYMHTCIHTYIYIHICTYIYDICYLTYTTLLGFEHSVCHESLLTSLYIYIYIHILYIMITKSLNI